ncbi:MAG TPA: SPFH domain-containing protein [Nitrososphaerales archaeon]
MSTIALQILGGTIDPSVYVVIIIALVLVWYFVLRGIFRIADDQIGILIRKFTGEKMPQGQVIARHGQIGIQARTLVPGLYYRFPLIWDVKRARITTVAEANIGLVESIDGKPLPKNRLLGDEVQCNSFQDAEAFLDGGGYKGPQVEILRPGRYRINTLAFNIEVKPATVVPADKLGLITAEDGLPLPSKLIIAPQPLTGSETEGKDPTYISARPHNYFQDGQAFLDSRGYRGPQLDTLQPGVYYINTTLFTVEVIDIAEIPPGFVAVLRSNVGEELERPEGVPVPPSSMPGFGEKLTHDVETLLTSDKTKRGILKDPIAPGKYNLNTHAYTAFLVPTSAVMIDWASPDRPASPMMARPSAQPTRDVTIYPITDDKTFVGQAYFSFNQLKVTSKDGFQLEVDVRMVIRVLPENASFVIARFGTVFNLIQQIVHPLIDASFRNKAGEKGALDFVQSRTQLQQEALAKAKQEFEEYHVEAQNLLISYILVPQDLLNTQTFKQIALQQQAQYQEQARAQEQRIAVAAKQAMADKQPDVIAAQLQITINENQAKAQVAQALGQRDATKTVADGNAYQTRVTGEAQANAYKAQASAIGPDRLTAIQLINLIQTGKVRITPDTLVLSGKDGDMTAGTLTAYLVTLLQKGTKSQPDIDVYEPVEHEEFRSDLLNSAPSQMQVSTPMTSPPASSTSTQTKQNKKSSGE